jgi:hypothetical protein
MGRVDEDAFPEDGGALVFIAASVREARRAEELLTTRGIDYALSFETYLRSGFFSLLGGSSEQTGVGFTVIAGVAEATRRLLREHGLRTGVVEDAP